MAAAIVPALALPQLAHADALAPSADLYVSARQPARNFGAARRLVISRRPARAAFLRYELGAAPAPNSRVVLYLYPLTSSKAGLRLRHASDRPWNERRITLRTAPGTGPRVVRTGALRARHWKPVDVTHLVDASGVVALSLGARGPGHVVLASREARSGAPRLVLQPAGAPVSATPPQVAAPAGSKQPSRGGAPAPAGPSGPPSPSPAPPAPPAVSPTSSRPCGLTTTAPAWQHVVWVIMENKAASQIMGSASAPYINGLAAKCASATSFYGVSHPSLPNYLAMTSGSTQGVTDDAAPSAHPIAAESIFSQLGSGWRSLQESMPSNCAKTSSGQYAVKHNPAAYYTNLGASCAAQDVALTDPPDLSARFTFITPNMCSDMHDCSIGAGDAWLATWMPRFLDSPQYRSGNTAVFLTFDEDDMSANNHIAMVVISPSTPSGMTNGTNYNHYAMLRTTQEMLGVAPLGAATSAPSMRSAFGL